MRHQAKEISRNIFSMMLGVITAVVIFIPLSILSLVFGGLIPFGDDPAANQFVYIVVLISVFISSTIGGYITGLFSEKNNLLYSTITGITLAIIYFLSDDFKINDKVFYSIVLIIIIPSVLLGNYLANRNKAKA
jgi:cation transport ATPase